MPAGGVGPRLLDQRLIMPEAHAVHAGQICGHLTQARVQKQPLHVWIVLPEIYALDKYIVVVALFAIFIHFLVQHALLSALAHGSFDRLPPRLQFVGAEKVVTDDETVFLVRIDLFLG